MTNSINNENTINCNDTRGISVMENSYVHVRVNSEDKEKAERILKELGTDLSGVVNMLLKQIQIKGGIPFDIFDETFIIENIKETMPNMHLKEEDNSKMEKLFNKVIDKR